MDTDHLREGEIEEEETVSNLAESIEEMWTPTNAHLVRRPILDVDMGVFAYELLYADAQGNENSDSSEVLLAAFLDIGLEAVSEDKLSLIEISEEFVSGELPLPFSPSGVVLQVPLESIQSSSSKAALKKLTSQGFRLALAWSDPAFVVDEFLDEIFLLRIDLDKWDGEQLEKQVPKYLEQGVRILAANVDTRDQLASCQEMNIDLFQGQFVNEPALVSGSTLKPNRMALLNILKLLEDPDCDISDLEELISQDITLSYKILRIINSAFYGFRREIDSVKQAVVSLGLKVIRDWFIIISLTDIDDKPQSLMFQTLHRARMMQLLSEVMGLNKDTGFTIGLFSSIDAIMDQPMETILKALPLSNEISEALLERGGMLGELLNIVTHYEKGEWKYLNSAGFEASELSTYYFESMHWTRDLFEQIKTD